MDRESFVTLLVGAKYGISQIINNKLNILTTLTEFMNISQVQLNPESEKVSMVKIYLQDIKPITLLMESHSAKDLACLIAGYYKLFVDSKVTVFTWTGNSKIHRISAEEEVGIPVRYCKPVDPYQTSTKVTNLLHFRPGTKSGPRLPHRYRPSAKTTDPVPMFPGAVPLPSLYRPGAKVTKPQVPTWYCTFTNTVVKSRMARELQQHTGSIPVAFAALHTWGRCRLRFAWGRCRLRFAWGRCRLRFAWGRCRLRFAWGRCRLRFAWGRCRLRFAWGRCRLCFFWGRFRLCFAWGRCRLCFAWGRCRLCFAWGHCQS
ncbi:UNVERIFIED_CONTAM: hypothetical protein FKN15_026290 [Acipenser sinensis]